MRFLLLPEVLSAFVSKVLLTAVFFVVLVPVAFVRRLCGWKDLRLAQWKRGRESVFEVREHVFRAEDMKHPF